MVLSTDKTVLITGAGGFIGLNTVQLFAENGWRIYATVHHHLPQTLIDLTKKYPLTLFQTDVSDEASVQKLWESFPEKPTVIVHVAGRASDIGSDAVFKKINFDSTTYLAKLGVQKFIYISSTDVYGIQDFNNEKEEDLPFCLYPNNPYPKYKIESEKWIQAHLSKENYVIIRPADVWGENDTTLESRFVSFLKISPFLVYFGKWRGQNRYPLASVKRVAQTILAVAQKDDWNGQAINIIDSTYTTLDAYYAQLIQKYFPHKKFKKLYLPLWVGKSIGLISTCLSNLFRMKQPLFDPSYYAVHHLAANLHLNGDKMKAVLADLEKEQGVCD